MKLADALFLQGHFLLNYENTDAKASFILLGWVGT